MLIAEVILSLANKFNADIVRSEIIAMETESNRETQAFLVRKKWWNSA